MTEEKKIEDRVAQTEEKLLEMEVALSQRLAGVYARERAARWHAFACNAIRAKFSTNPQTAAKEAVEAADLLAKAFDDRFPQEKIE